jgi:hypothetical protein
MHIPCCSVTSTFQQQVSTIYSMCSGHCVMCCAVGWYRSLIYHTLLAVSNNGLYSSNLPW